MVSAETGLRRSKQALRFLVASLLWRKPLELRSEWLSDGEARRTSTGGLDVFSYQRIVSRVSAEPAACLAPETMSPLEKASLTGVTLIQSFTNHLKMLLEKEKLLRTL